tara:strand:+ start:2418 stop:3062 length:645 start_codon:yes stop_codon:yes gene_type:complete
MNNKMNGKFIVIEGIDGCGKTTQINEICKWLPDSGLIANNKTVIKTREPGGSEMGGKLRELILSNDKNDPPSDLTELLLYSADRAEHINKIISPALKIGNWVVSDRFSGSTAAYQGYGRKINIDIINKLETIACQGINPNITFFLEISPEESIVRRKNKIPDRIESEGINFLKNVNEGFRILAREKKWETISATNEISVISNKIKQILMNKFSK